jgi:hypothetical protein
LKDSRSARKICSECSATMNLKCESWTKRYNTSRPDQYIFRNERYIIQSTLVNAGLVEIIKVFSVQSFLINR